jgi:hypothetical protein
LSPVEAAGETFGTVADNWLKRHVDAQGLRSAPKIKRLLNVHVRPRSAEREFVSIKKSDGPARRGRGCAHAAAGRSGPGGHPQADEPVRVQGR